MHELDFLPQGKDHAAQDADKSIEEVEDLQPKQSQQTSARCYCSKGAAQVQHRSLCQREHSCTVLATLNEEHHVSSQEPLVMPMDKQLKAQHADSTLRGNCFDVGHNCWSHTVTRVHMTPDCTLKAGADLLGSPAIFRDTPLNPD